jgi:hypothetical protein
LLEAFEHLFEERPMGKGLGLIDTFEKLKVAHLG